MNIFLSWSGDYSKQIATEFHDWIPFVLQDVDPFMSSEDIDLGMGWNDLINSQLNEAELGIIFVTRENMNSPWLNFESGALSKSFSGTNKVIPIVFDDDKKAVLFNQYSPLKQFQSVLSPDRDGIKSLITTLNSEIERQLTKERLDSTFDKFYPDLEKKLSIAKDSYTKDTAVGIEEDKTVSINDLSDKIDVIMETIQKTNVVRSAGIRGVNPRAIEDLLKSYKQIKSIEDELVLLKSNIDDVAGNTYLDLAAVIKNIDNVLQDMRVPINHLKRTVYSNRRVSDSSRDDLSD